MSNSIIPAAPAAPPTAAQLLQQRATMLANQQAQAFRQVQQVFQQTAAFIWKDPAKAQAAFDAFTSAGFKASDLFVNAGAYSAMVQAVTGTAPPSPVPAGWSYTVNADGSVTVSGPTAASLTKPPEALKPA
jgi:hypothetical protein